MGPTVFLILAVSFWLPSACASRYESCLRRARFEGCDGHGGTLVPRDGRDGPPAYCEQYPQRCDMQMLEE